MLKHITATILAFSSLACQSVPQAVQATRAPVNTDWAQLGKYHDANLDLVPDATRTVFIGDSITQRWDLDTYFPGQSYVNRGISGQTSPQLLVRFMQDVISLKPATVVILVGTNDIGGNTGPTTTEAIMNNLTAMTNLAKASNIRVVLCSVLPVSNYEGRDRTTLRDPARIRELNASIQAYTDANAVEYVDYYSAMVDSAGFMTKGLSVDGLHPSPAGYEIMRDVLNKTLTKGN